MKTLSRSMKANCHFTVDSKMSVASWTVLEAFLRLKGVVSTLYSPWCTENVKISCTGRRFRLANTQNWRQALRISVLCITNPNSHLLVGLDRLPWWSQRSDFCIVYRTVANCYFSKQLQMVVSISTAKALQRSWGALCRFFPSQICVLLVQLGTGEVERAYVRGPGRCGASPCHWTPNVHPIFLKFERVSKSSWLLSAYCVPILTCYRQAVSNTLSWTISSSLHLSIWSSCK